MIYFDHAATSYPKPPEVLEEAAKVIKHFAGNPGRGDYALAKDSGHYLYQARKTVAEFLGIRPSSNLIFTDGCTTSANVLLKGYLRQGDHVVFSSMEHNANWRPLKALESRGISLTKVNVLGDAKSAVSRLEGALTHSTRLFVAVHGSNVSGDLLPLEELTECAHRYGIKVYCDMAQTAGFLPMNLSSLGVDFASFAGHKSLLGPGGVGMLYIKDEKDVAPLKHGGTGMHSESPDMPEFLPDRLESGTPNLMGIGGLMGGIRYIKNRGVEQINRHEISLTERFLAGLEQMDHVTVYGPQRGMPRVPVVSLNVGNLSPHKTSQHLEEKAEIAVRSGLHCSPLAHETLGTLGRGTVRFSFGYHNTEEEVDTALEVLNDLKFII